MTQVAQIDLPWPPSTNGLHRPVHIGKGRLTKCMTKGYSEWKKHAQLEIMSQKPKRVRGEVEITITLYPPNRREYDGDNKVKALFDALVDASVIDGDSNRTIKRHHVINEEPVKEGFARVFIEQVEV